MGRGYGCVCGGGGGGMEIIYLSLHCHTRMASGLRWAAMRAILIFQLIVRDKVTRQCPQTTPCQEKGEPKQI